jgi:hypothetical protein
LSQKAEKNCRCRWTVSEREASMAKSKQLVTLLLGFLFSTIASAQNPSPLPESEGKNHKVYVADTPVSVEVIRSCHGE